VSEPPATGAPVYSVGHGTLPAEAFLDLLRTAKIDQIVDIRSFPGSRRNPHYDREEMERWLPEGGTGYRWIRGLGGRRRPVVGSKHLALHNEAFRAYADHMETPTFRQGLAELWTSAPRDSIAVLCSESLWWRCHRRLLADHLVLVEGIDVLHLMHDGRISPHATTEGVRRSDTDLVYDVGTTPPMEPA
jgi:uncharacterized protein (DUF488 family)